MSVMEFVHSEPAFTILGAALGAAWTFFKSRDWYARLRRRRYSRALQALEAAVEKTYRTYVRAIKDAREDGRLTRQEMDRAREIARAEAIAFGRTEGVDVLRELGEDYLDLLIARIVKKLRDD